MEQPSTNSPCCDLIGTVYKMEPQGIQFSFPFFQLSQYSAANLAGEAVASAGGLVPDGVSQCSPRVKSCVGHD